MIGPPATSIPAGLSLIRLAIVRFATAITTTNELGGEVDGVSISTLVVKPVGKAQIDVLLAASIPLRYLSASGLAWRRQSNTWRTWSR